MKQINLNLENLNIAEHAIQDYRCPCQGEVCDGYGHVFTENGALLCPCLQKNLDNNYAENLFSEWNINPIHFDSIPAMKGFTENIIYKAINRMYLRIKENKKPICVVLLGPHGRGKTFMSISLLYTLALEDYPVCAIEFPQFAESIKFPIQYEKYIRKTEKRIQDAKIIFIDEFGREQGFSHNEHVWPALRKIIFHNIGKKYLILASNYSKDVFKKSFPSDLWDRLENRMSLGISKNIIQDAGDSLRWTKWHE